MADGGEEKKDGASTSEECGVYDFADGGRYVGEWKNGGADGHGICVGPMDSGVFNGKWLSGHQSSGVFKWNNGQRYMGTWENGNRHGLGIEIRPDGSEYTGDFHESTRGPFGVLRLSSGAGAVYKGTWEHGLQDGVGVEVYTDKGVYKGQYKKGFRNGYGTRSSHGYELLHEKKQNIIASSTSSGKSNDASTKRASSLNRRPISASSTNRNGDNLVRTTSSSSLSSYSSRSDFLGPTSPIPLMDADKGSNIQIYEGQWYKDKRHGHGVLRVPGHYTYCGEWSHNSRTGNGILMYEDGRREEGAWENGQLVLPLKRKKISIKYHQLEVKVKQAHTLALQAADVARTKSLLAESRATAASSRAKLAMKAAEEANMNAETAKAKADLLCTAEHKLENIATPSVVQSNSMEGLPFDKGETESLLSVPSISLSPSMENIEASVNGNNTSISTTPSLRRNIHSQSDSLLVDSTEEDSNVLSLALPTNVPTRRGSESCISLRRTSEHTLEKQPSLPSTQSELNSAFKRVDNNTDGLRLEDTPPTAATSNLTHRQPWPARDSTTSDQHQKVLTPDNQTDHQKISLDVIKQMANWNKTIAYINFILLLFLLLLIVFIVAFLSTTLSQNNPANFMNHMA